MDKSVSTFEKHREQLFNIAYGMLGRVTSVEDVVQEAYLRWRKVEVDKIDSPMAYISTIVSRICLDQLKSAHNRKESYVGPDLPEPLLESDRASPEEETELAESLSMALLVVLKKLTPVQRAVFLLYEVFDYDYASIAESVQMSETHCRKIGQRARDHIRQNRPRFDVDYEQKNKLLHSFMKAIQKGNIANLEQMLAEEAILFSDGGGKVSAVRKPIFGANNIARFMVGIQKNRDKNDVEVRFSSVNGEPGLIVYIGDELHSVWSFDMTDNTIQHIFIILNPEKLEHLLKKG